MTTTLEPISLLLMYAPAGYGKTPTVADRVGALAADTAWYRLEIGDNDRARFAGYLANALEVAVPGNGTTTLSKLQEKGYDIPESFLTDMLAKLPPAVLCLSQAFAGLYNRRKQAAAPQSDREYDTK